VASLAEPAPMLIQIRCPPAPPDPPEQITVRVDVVSTAAPERTSMLVPNAITVSLTVQI
jgi:hypothetical protein